MQFRYRLLSIFSLSVGMVLANADCNSLLTDFSYQQSQPYSSPSGGKWGPKANQFQLSSEQQACAQDPNWARQRILATAEYWILQKLNYCHHHVPTFRTTDAQITRQQTTDDEFCASNLNLAHNAQNGQLIRWNYSGLGNETADNWQANTMWYGFDCSDFTAWVYNFGLGIFFNPAIYWQAGVSFVNDGRSPNAQTEVGELQNGKAPGNLVCRDGSLENSTLCANGYFSTIDNQGLKTIILNNQDYAKLQAGDILFVGATQRDLAGNPNGQNIVTHAYLWTAKKIGNAKNEIPLAKIAPHKPYDGDDCMPKVGNWVIIDSTYQGPDYRSFCTYYNKNIWGVRRVIQ